MKKYVWSVIAITAVVAGGYLILKNKPATITNNTAPAPEPIPSQSLPAGRQVAPSQGGKNNRAAPSPSTNPTSPSPSPTSPTPSPASKPQPQPQPAPSPTPTTPPPTPSPSPQIQIQSFSITADDSGASPSAITVPKGSEVNLTFNVKSTGVYYGGLDFRSQVVNTGTILAGQSKTVSFTTNESFEFVPYWPGSGVRKGYTIKVNAQ